MCLLRARDLAGAGAAFTAAEEHGADADACGGGRWQVAMLRGEMEAAWCETDRIRARGKPDAHRFWDGTTLAGKKVVIRCLHGFGDTIQMLPYVARVLSVAARVVLEVPPELLALVQALPLARADRLQVITWGAGRPSVEPEWETQVEVIGAAVCVSDAREGSSAGAGVFDAADGGGGGDGPTDGRSYAAARGGGVVRGGVECESGDRSGNVSRSDAAADGILEPGACATLGRGRGGGDLAERLQRRVRTFGLGMLTDGRRDRESGSADHNGYAGGSPGGRDGDSGVGAAAVCGGLAMDGVGAWTRRGTRRCGCCGSRWRATGRR